MNLEITELKKEEADRLMRIKGMTKGSEILTLGRYVEAKYGKKGLELLEKKMEELGYPLYFNQIRPAYWYSEGHNILAMIVAKEIFGWKDLFDLGYQSPVFSFGAKVFIKFLPLSLFCNKVPKIWRKFVDVGNLEIAELNEKEKYCIIRLSDYMFHPEMCSYYAGFFLRMGELVIKGKKFRIEEIKCMYKGDPYHEYLVKWE